MKKLCVVLISLVIPLQLGAGAQSQTTRLAYDSCRQYYGEIWWELRCEIGLFNGDASVSIGGGTEPGWTSDGLRIAAVDDDGNILLHSLVSDTTVKLTGIGPVVGAPRWSPDNTRIAFTSDRDGQQNLYVINADGSALTRLTDMGVWVSFSWSPDGAAIVFAGNRDGQKNLYVVNADGSALTRLTDMGVGGGFARSPDGTAIAFGAAGGGVLELFVMQPDGSNKTRLTYNVGFETNTTPSWSFDGTRIAFGCANDICSINADGTNFRRLTTDPVFASGGVFSPVDGRIAFATGRFGRVEVAILEENGAVTRVAPGLWASDPSWSPGGGSLALVDLRPVIACNADGSCFDGQDDRVYTVGRDGNGLRQVGWGHHPRWAPSLPGQPAATFTYNCASVACQFDATGSFDPDGSLASYAWDFGDGTTASGATAAHQYGTPATYRVKLIVTDHGGAVGLALRHISANAPPVASFTVTCDGPTCTFDASTSSDPDGTIKYYVWYFGDGGIQAGPTVTHTYPTGTFLAKLFIGDSGGSQASAELMLSVVNAVPVADFTVACVSLTCTFDASASSDDDGPIVYRWNFGDGGSSFDKTPTHMYWPGGTYLATLTVTDNAGQTATTSRTVNAIEPPMHVGNLDGSRTILQGTWDAFVTVEIHRDDHQGLAGAAISGTWDDGTTAWCGTDSSGRCVLSRYGLGKKAAVRFTVVDVMVFPHVYNPAANHDPDGGSNGTSITVRRR